MGSIIRAFMPDNQSTPGRGERGNHQPARVRVIVVMGVSGAGKTTVGLALAHRLHWLFIEGDEFHPRRNVEAMAAGHALTDADRVPWLAALRQRIEEVLAAGECAVVACSALRHAYRSVLAGPEGGTEVRFVHLDVPEPVLRARLTARHGHFMPPELLGSQLATLEPSTTALVVDGTRTVDEIVQEILERLAIA
jgi:gluconokinase